MAPPGAESKVMNKAYQPELFESRLYGWWEKEGFFKPQNADSKAPAFCIVIPPPNVTGALHNGHALFLTIQDVLVRWKRMRGYNTLWLPGTDHAGIATQMVVERDLSKQGIIRQKIGRAAFVEKVWEWKNKHGDLITNQMRVMGASVDWTRERFTMDEGLSAAVREVFVRLFDEGLIYRGSYIINWCSKCQTALSDLEVIPKEKKGHLWHIRYGKNIVIATTRPETLLGDAAVAVHPDDERYQEMIGKTLELPLTNRKIPVVADTHVEREFGTGALKVTPGHDFNDYEIGKRHKLSHINIFTRDGKVNEAGGVYAGLKISDARDKVIADLESQGLLEKVEDHALTVGVCERCETVAEPMVSDQWFVKASVLAEPALKAMKKGELIPLEEIDSRDDAIKILPEQWTSTYYHWMENIRDWCISRQLWWGHQIPAWYCDACGKMSVSKMDLDRCPRCENSKPETFRREQDVLDTWFSSALWPFSTLGWPEKTNDLKTFYPTEILETGTDILFFWVARMVMMGMHFMDGKVPFHRVYLHSLVRDEKGQKMSKTKGNVIDPLDVVKTHGADAFRFTLTSLAGQGRDIRLSVERVGVDRAFCNKLWNASRYALMRLGIVEPPVSESTGKPIEGLAPPTPLNFQTLTGKLSLSDWVLKNHSEFHVINRWVISKLQDTVHSVNEALEEFRLSDAASDLYHFTWGTFCDWYIEFTKELLKTDETNPQPGPYVMQTYACLTYVLEQTLRLAHPIIPFITEEIYQHLPRELRAPVLMTASYPEALPGLRDETADQLLQAWCEVIDKVRTFRGENSISPKLKISAYFGRSESVVNEKSLAELAPFLKLLAQVSVWEPATAEIMNDEATSKLTTSLGSIYIPLRGLVDFAAELQRVEKEALQTKTDMEFLEKKLSNESFVARAPESLIAEQREKLEFLKKKSLDLLKNKQRLTALLK